MSLQMILRCAAVAAVLLAARLASASTPAPARGDAAIELTRLSPAQIAVGREQVAQQMIRQGRDPEAARQMAAQLTEADLLVLVENPKMMQEAGEANAQLNSLILATLVIGGLVVLLITADSGFATQS